MRSFFSAHSMLFMISLAAIINFDWLMQMKKRLSMNAFSVLISTILFECYILLSVMTFAVVETGFDFSKFGNRSLFGAVFLVPLGLWIEARLIKRDVAEVMDVFSIPAVVTALFARVNCLIAGCCIGEVITGTQRRWPTREMEILYYVIFLLIFAPRVFQRKTSGEVYPICMIAYGVVRFILEFFRETDRAESLFHLPHIWALISIGVGFILLARRKQRNGPKRVSVKNNL